MARMYVAAIMGSHSQGIDCGGRHGGEVARVTLSPAGRYAVVLPPGTYRLVPLSPPDWPLPAPWRASWWKWAPGPR